jgi:hypothetical protein
MYGKDCWYVVDGYRPPVNAGGRSDYKGHECYMILNCNEQDAHVLIDIFYKDKPPVLGIPLTVPAQRMVNFYSDDVETLGGVKLSIGEDYSMRFRSDVGVVVQYGRMDINQPNLAYLATMGYAD